MALFEDLTKKVGDFTKNTVAKSKEYLDIASLNSEISNQRNIIQKTYEHIGEKYYSENSSSPVDDYKEFFDTIAEAAAKIADLQDKVDVIKGTGACPTCGSEIPKGSKFCANCGSKVAEPQVAPDMKKCPECENYVEESAKFCDVCGHKF